MFRYIFHKYSRPEVNETLNSLTLSANIETLIWEWRRDFPWLRIHLIILCLPFTWNDRFGCGWVVARSRLPSIPHVFDPLSYWSQYLFPTQIISFVQSLTHITTLELAFLPETGVGTWHYKLPGEHLQPSYFCEVLKCLAPKLLRLSLRNWPRGEEDFTEAVQFPELKTYIWNPCKWKPLSCLHTLRESLRGSNKLEEIGVAFYLHDKAITEAGVLPIYVEELLYPHLHKLGIIWWARATLIPTDVRQFLYLYQDTIQRTLLNVFQRSAQPGLPTSGEDVLSLLNPSKLRSICVDFVPEHRYERFRSAMMASTTLHELSLALDGISSSDNAFAFLPNLSFLKLEFQNNFWWGEPLWALMKTLPSSLPALKKLEMKNGWALMEALPGNSGLVDQAQGRRTAPQELLDYLPYTQKPYIHFTDSLRAVLETPRWQSWGLEEVEIEFRRDRSQEDQRFVHTFMAKYLPKVVIFGGIHRSML
ncbi:hypothetical protein DL96DRAFT_1285159 [Flagelloscypha sp. PMI_526]|nr:hypothetical protein DL96DRAFT_1285159 [Flagelloscypha sp. PMI_526]